MIGTRITIKQHSVIIDYFFNFQKHSYFCKCMEKNIQYSERAFFVVVLNQQEILPGY